jgi:hypothetical protein
VKLDNLAVRVLATRPALQRIGDVLLYGDDSRRSPQKAKASLQEIIVVCGVVERASIKATQRLMDGRQLQ